MNRPARWSGLMALSIMLLTASCGNDEIEKPGVTLYPVIESQLETVVQTRALTGSYIPYTGTTQSIYAHAIAFKDDVRHSEEDAHGLFYRYSNTWLSTVDAKEGSQYYLYAHTALPGASSPTLLFTDKDHVSLSFNGLSVVTENDPMMCCASTGKTLPDNPAQATWPELTKGLYNIGTVENTIVDEQQVTTKVFMAMDHLFAKATILFSIDATYNELRTIRVTGVEIVTENGNLAGTHTYSYNTGNLTPATWTPSTGSQHIDLFEGENAVVEMDEESPTEVTLTTTPLEFGWFCFLPLQSSAPQLKLVVTYNVYDKSGNLTREAQTAVNANILNRLTSPVAGTDYHVSIVVSPTYLYQLSDDDVEMELLIDSE